ncbi:ABC-2 transporter permease [Neobacillus mesonae]|nr:ABC-2 transporter permease [Neobacillus mesonae]
MSSRVWKQAWWMTKNDLWRDRFNWIWTLLFTAYTGLICGSLMHGAVEDKGYTLMGDNMFLMFVPFLGFFFSRRSFRYLQEDSYTQMLAYMRRLPVPTIAILWNRIIQMLITFLINGLVFFALIYFAELRSENFGLSGVLAFAVTWIAYGLFINAMFIFWEFNMSGKWYFVLTMIMFVICIGGALVAAILDQNLIEITMQQSAAYGLLAPVMWGTLLVGAVSLAVSFKLTYKQLLKRDLS